MYHGVPRTTVDIDIILHPKDNEIQVFTEFLQSKDFDVSTSAISEALTDASHCTIFVDESLLRLDIQGVLSEFDRMTLERAIVVEHLGTRVRLGTVEDTIINKILFHGEQDLRDALGIYVRKSDMIDLDYIEKTCSILGINEKWNSFQEHAKRTIEKSASED